MTFQLTPEQEAELDKELEAEMDAVYQNQQTPDFQAFAQKADAQMYENMIAQYPPEHPTHKIAQEALAKLDDEEAAHNPLYRDMKAEFGALSATPPSKS